MKKRLDHILVEKGLVADIDTAGRFIGAGEVYVDESVIDKAGARVDENAEIRVKEKSRFVSRGGEKLAAAFAAFDITAKDKVCLDVGASTGGFTDCLLQHGAAQVFAVDVAYGQLAWKLRQDRQVTVIERCNARHLTLEKLGNAMIELAVTDVSFISLTKVLPAMITVFTETIDIVALIKPQYELPYADIPPGGVVVDERLHEKAVNKILGFVGQWQEPKLHTQMVLPSPLLGPKGNREFLIHITS